jgi:hypothetical protein
VARRLIVIPRPGSRLEAAERIGPGYPRDYTESDMRHWADDVQRLNATPPDELQRLRSLSRDRLTPAQRGVVDAHEHYFTDPSRGIKGSLREDGIVELDGGRHRAAYLIEREEPVPVWVSCPDERRLDEYAVRCEREMAQGRERANGRSHDDRDRGDDRVRA